MTRHVLAFAKFGKESCAYVGQIYHVLQKPERAANLTEADSLWIPAGDLIQTRKPFRDQVRIADRDWKRLGRSEEQTSELQSLMRSSYDDFCLKKIIYSDTISLLFTQVSLHSNSVPYETY